MSQRPSFADFEAAVQAQIEEGRTYLSENGYEATEAQVLALLEDARARICARGLRRAQRTGRGVAGPRRGRGSRSLGGRGWREIPIPNAEVMIEPMAEGRMISMVSSADPPRAELQVEGERDGL